MTPTVQRACFQIVAKSPREGRSENIGKMPLMEPRFLPLGGRRKCGARRLKGKDGIGILKCNGAKLLTRQMRTWQQYCSGMMMYSNGEFG
jgi:hypothetical protein